MTLRSVEKRGEGGRSGWNWHGVRALNGVMARCSLDRLFRVCAYMYIRKRKTGVVSLEREELNKRKATTV